MNAQRTIEAPRVDEPGDDAHPVPCRSCGYDLGAVKDASRCPECGRSLLDMIRDEPGPMFSSTSRRRVGARPLWDVQFGGSRNGRLSRARGFIAVGDYAIGVVAIGVFARGVVSFGVVTLGVFSLGVLGIGLLAAGTLAVGAVALGGFGVGLLARGGKSYGLIADGGSAVGVYARGGQATGRYVIDPSRQEQAAIDLFQGPPLFLGPATPIDATAILLWIAAAVGLIVAAGALLAAAGIAASRPAPSREPASFGPATGASG